MASAYNRSAWFYDRLSRLVFGRAQLNAQIYLLQYIPANAHILIVGGGTGWILEEINNIHTTGLSITYIEPAANMVTLAKQRQTGNNKVVYITDKVENYTGNHKFDIIMTPFLFDNFSQVTTNKVFKHLHNLLKHGGLWLYTDFQLTGKWWQRLLLKAMYLFFGTLGEMETSALPDTSFLFKEYGFKMIASSTFYRHFIISAAYQLY